MSSVDNQPGIVIVVSAVGTAVLFQVEARPFDFHRQSENRQGRGGEGRGGEGRGGEGRGGGKSSDHKAFTNKVVLFPFTG